MHRLFHTNENDAGNRTLIQRMVALIAFVGVAIGTFSGHANAASTYVITDGTQMIVLSSESHDPRIVLEEAGFVPNETDIISSEEVDGVSTITIDHLKMVHVYCDGLLTVTGVSDATVGEVLDNLDITLGETDRVSCPLDQQVYDDMRVTVTRVRVETLDETTVTPHETIYYEDNSLAAGEEFVLIPGQDGNAKTTTVVTYEDGVEVSREVTFNEVYAETVTEVVLRGPEREMAEQDTMLDVYEAPAPTQMTSSSTTSSSTSSSASASSGSTSSSAASSGSAGSIDGTSYCKVLSMQATAYTCGDQTGITATGTVACVGTVAVDPSVIPLGTKMYITSADGQYVYGYCTALDTGGAIKGNIVDLYFNTYAECWQFGRRNVNVYILG